MYQLLSKLFIITTFFQCAICISMKFPDDFIFGVGTSAHQIEGGWNASGKGPSIWDHMSHTKSFVILDGSNGDVACDSYHHYKRDVQMVKELGCEYYRFSISWSRVLPSGTINDINLAGVNYYNNLINELIKNDIKPCITLHHFDLPQKLLDLGGWANRAIVDYFVHYAELMFKLYGDRVKLWITINEPYYTVIGYGSLVGMAPYLTNFGIGNYLAGHNVLLAHAHAWHLYDKSFRSVQKGRIAITLCTPWVDPYTDSPKDKEIANTILQFQLGWFAHPIFSKEGDYPEIMKQQIYNNSMAQGFPHSRLPAFTPEEIQLLKGSSDFFGINNYETTTFKERNGKVKNYPVPSYVDDMGYDETYNDYWIKTNVDWFKIKLGAFRDLLNWIKNEYNSPEIIVTENGYSSDKGLVDYGRVTHMNRVLTEVLEAMYEDKCNVTGFFYWCLMDDFEWFQGYALKFGLYDVDFESKNRTRTPKMSAFVYKEIMKTKTVNPYFIPDLPASYKNSGTIFSLSKYNILMPFTLLFMVTKIMFN